MRVRRELRSTYSLKAGRERGREGGSNSRKSQERMNEEQASEVPKKEISKSFEWRN